MRWAHNVLAASVAASVVSTGTAVRKCPPPDKVSQAGGSNREVIFHNLIDSKLDLYWVDPDNQEVVSGFLEAGDVDPSHRTFTGHVFRARRSDTKRLVWEYEMTDASPKVVEIHPCDDEGRYTFDVSALDEEYKELMHDQRAPCEGPSPQWSCVRHVSKEEYAKRWPPAYGFTQQEINKGSMYGRRARQQFDDTYVDHIDTVPHLSEGPGYLKMTIPEPLRTELLEFFATHESKATLHEPIGGAFANNAHEPFDKIDLDTYRFMHRKVVENMKKVMQWWTKQRLIHTSTFGVRLYRQGASLLNHVDRGDTHLASAVLQIAQDANDGWPLEVMTEAGGLVEVYLQPGEMVLYEGARALHGRPMRFNGTMFANVFTHFAPPDFGGTPSGYTPNDGKFWREFQSAAEEQYQKVFKYQMGDAAHSEL